jgi:hypothetical protein
MSKSWCGLGPNDTSANEGFGSTGFAAAGLVSAFGLSAISARTAELRAQTQQESRIENRNIGGGFIRTPKRFSWAVIAMAFEMKQSISKVFKRQLGHLKMSQP